MRHYSQGLARASIVLATLVWWGCGGSGAGPAGPGQQTPTVSSLDLTPGADTLFAFGSTTQFSASPKDASGNPVSGQTITWSSSDPSIVSVSSSGLATAVGNGTATITASVGTVEAGAQLLVNQRPASVTVTPSSGALTAIGDTVRFSAVAKDANGNQIDQPDFLWLSSNHNVATIDQTGLATATGSGMVDIIAASGGLPGSATLAVNVPVTASPSMSRVSVGPQTGLPADGYSSAEIEVEVRDANGNPMQGETVSLAVAADPDLSGATLVQPTAVTDANGIATGSITSTSFGAKQITATVDPNGAAVVLSDKPVVSFGATHLAWTTSPQTEPSGTRWGDAAVAYEDADGNTVTTAARPVTIALTSNSSGGSIMGGSLTQNPTNGVAMFNTHGIAFPGTGYRVTATAAGVSQIASAESDAFDVTGVSIVSGSTTLNTVSNCDDCAESVLFSTFTDFPFYGVLFGSVQVTSNGFLAFTSQSITNFTNDTIPDTATPNGVVAGFWDDLRTTSNPGTIKWTVTGSAPNRAFVVQYDNVPFYCSSCGGNYSGAVNFNVILHETTNRIQFIYGGFSGGSGTQATGGSATIGIENRDGTGGTLISFNQANAVRNGLSIWFEYDGTNYNRIMINP